MKLKNGWSNRILIIDDDDNIHQDIEETLGLKTPEQIATDLAEAFGSVAEKGFLPELNILHAKSGKEGFEQVKMALERNEPIAVAYVDMRMPPGWDG
ncbi:MAG: hypothetical protein ACPL7B_13920, partial [Candidatus Poribacteria bacterium]